MKYFHKVKIDGLPSMENRMTHWAKEQKARNVWHRLVAGAFATYKPKTPIKRCKLYLERCTADACDFDNLVRSFKAPIDGLVKAGIIADDDMKTVVDRHYSYVKVPRKEAHITITVEELE